VAGATRLELATSGVTGWLLNQNNKRLENQMNSLPLFTLNCISKVGNRVGKVEFRNEKGLRN